jgi:hypothetical protein
VNVGAGGAGHAGAGDDHGLRVADVKKVDLFEDGKVDLFGLTIIVFGEVLAEVVLVNFVGCWWVFWGTDAKMRESNKRKVNFMIGSTYSIILDLRSDAIGNEWCGVS